MTIRHGNEKTSIRILIADDWPNVQVALRVMLEQQLGFEVVGEVVDAEELLAWVETVCPDVLLLGWELPGLAGTDLLPALRRACPKLLVIVLSGRPEARRAALDAGADAFVSKMAPPDRLLAVISCVKQRERSNLSYGSKIQTGTNDEKEKETDTRRLIMSELTTQNRVGSKGKGAHTAIIAVSISAAVVALACGAALIVTTILILDAIPFHHIFPH